MSSNECQSTANESNPWDALGVLRSQESQSVMQ